MNKGRVHWGKLWVVASIGLYVGFSGVVLFRLVRENRLLKIREETERVLLERDDSFLRKQWEIGGHSFPVELLFAMDPVNGVRLTHEAYSRKDYA